MSTELVKRLRDYAHNCGGDPRDYLTWHAADRIDVLEAALREIKDYLGYTKNNNKPSAQIADNAHSAWKIARAALVPEQDK